MPTTTGISRNGMLKSLEVKFNQSPLIVKCIRTLLLKKLKFLNLWNTDGHLELSIPII